MKAERQDDANVCVTVRDTGSGIPPEFHASVFDAFTQLDGSMTRAQEGLGIGLALVKQLLALQNGQIRVISDGMNQGTTFEVTLPLSHRTLSLD